MNIKKILFGLVAFPLLIGLSGCDDDEEQTSIKVGLVIPLSGSLGTLGAGLQNSAELALSDANASRNNKIEFILEDSQSTVDGATTAFNKLIQQDGVNAIIGPVTSSASQAAFPVAQQNKVVAFSPLAAAGGLSDIGDYVFQGNLSTDIVIPGGIDLTVAKFAYQNVAILVDTTDVFSQSTAQALENSLITKASRFSRPKL